MISDSDNSSSLNCRTEHCPQPHLQEEHFLLRPSHPLSTSWPGLYLYQARGTVWNITDNLQDPIGWVTFLPHVNPCDRDPRGLEWSSPSWPSPGLPPNLLISLLGRCLVVAPPVSMPNPRCPPRFHPLGPGCASNSSIAHCSASRHPPLSEKDRAVLRCYLPSSMFSMCLYSPTSLLHPLLLSLPLSGPHGSQGVVWLHTWLLLPCHELCPQ